MRLKHFSVRVNARREPQKPIHGEDIEQIHPKTVDFLKHQGHADFKKKGENEWRIGKISPHTKTCDQWPITKKLRSSLT